MSLVTRLGRARRRIFDTLRFFEGAVTAPSPGLTKDLAARGLAYREVGADDPKAFAAVRKRLNLPPDAEARVDAGDQLLLLEQAGGDIVSIGWRTRRPIFPVSEIGLFLHAGGRPIFYDFYTPAEHQRNGYHEAILRMAFSSGDGSQKGLIYTHHDNVPPLRVYAKMGLSSLNIFGLLISGLLRRR